MRKQARLVNMLFVAMLNFIFIFGFPLATMGQFAVISTIPADGATNVDTASTFQITFSAPLDTSVRFDYPTEFYLNLVLHPDSLVGKSDSITLSPDLTTVYVHNLHLTSDTRYLFLIANAVSATQDSLSMPYLATFTTGGSLPTAAVSGTVSFPGIDVTGTAVVLFDAPLFTEEEAEAENAAIVQTSLGDYTINYVSPGTYWPVAINDYRIDAAGGLEPNVGGNIGFYDPDADGMPDSIIVSGGQQVSGIDISLFSLASVTARHHYPAVETSAQSWASDAALIMLASWEISPSGEASNWMYAFYSPTLATCQAWLTMGALVIPLAMDEPPEIDIALPPNWLDSDIVADSAEVHGGGDFRAQYSDATVQAFLTTMELPGSQLFRQKPQNANKSLFARWSTTGILSSPFQRREEKTGISFQQAISFQNYQAVWAFLYSSEAGGEQLYLLFDAVTGEHIQPLQPAETTARFNLDITNQAAQSWASDTELVMVGTHQSNLTPTGDAMMWFFIYHSASQDSEQVFFASNGMFLGQGPIWDPPSKIALPVNWIDSDVAIDTAEAHGGSQYRAGNQDVTVSGGVSRSVFPGKPDLAVWEFQYTSSAANRLRIYIDAVTGEYIQPTQPAETTARFNLDVANQSAQTWSSDAELVWVQTHQSNLSPDGKAEMWLYAYYSASLDSGQAFFFSNGMPVGQRGGELPFKVALPANWLDSDGAIDTAETRAGTQYRANNQDVWVNGGIARGLFPAQPDRAVWFFDYNSSTADPLRIYVDALTGELIIFDTDITARYRLAEVDQEAKNWAADAVLVHVGFASPMPPDGTSSGWSYVFYSSSQGAYRVFYALATGPISSETISIRPPSNEALPDDWIDSDIATAAAEASGGSAYRSRNPGLIMGGTVSKNMLDYWGRPSQAVWRFGYASGTESTMFIFIDAVSGAHLATKTDVATDARYNLEAAEFSAPGFASDARLTYVMNNTGSLDEQGRSSDSWLFSYYSAANAAFVSFQIIAGQVVFVYPNSGGLDSHDPLPDNWINSNQAVLVAEAHGGSNFRASFSDTRVEGLLTKNYPGENYNISPEQAVWRIQYNSTAADSYLVVLIDAVTGEYIQPIVGVEITKDSQIIPESFSLDQNYPNPFNPETTIEFALPKSAFITIKVYNLLGEQVATLVAEQKSAGIHKINWDARALASGVYLCRMEAVDPSAGSGQDFVQSKKIILMR